MQQLHNSSSSDEYSGVCVRSSFSELSVTDLISFLRDVQKFLDRLNHEDLSADCLEIKQSLSSRIDFYTKKSRSDWQGQSTNNLPSVDYQHHQRSSRLSLTESRAPPLPARKIRQQFSSAMDISLSQSETEESSYSTTNTSSDWEEPSMTSTPLKQRNTTTTTQASLLLEEEAEDDDEYDVVEIREGCGGQVGPQVSLLGLQASSARAVGGIAEHQGYLYKKESIFKSTRYWAAVAQSTLFLFSDINSASCKESHNLEDAFLKRHKKEPKKFLVQLSGTYKNKNAKQEYQTDNADLAQAWIHHLENGIATAGKTPNTRRKLSTIKLGESQWQKIFCLSNI